ncbi:MAG TPA: TIGR02588 family protein [Longimicrobiaceae bacterium]|nr:TIGR02588 family protein [Longimicrobiaceae bacterium]
MPQRAKEEVSAWEWVAAGLGTALLLAAVGFLVHQGLTLEDGPPHIVLQVDSVHPGPGGYVVEFTARNEGGTTAAGLLVEGELQGGSGPPETSEVTIDFVPAEGERKAGLVFAADPRRHPLRLRAKGYDEP